MATFMIGYNGPGDSNDFHGIHKGDEISAKKALVKYIFECLEPDDFPGREDEIMTEEKVMADIEVWENGLAVSYEGRPGNFFDFYADIPNKV